MKTLKTARDKDGRNRNLGGSPGKPVKGGGQYAVDPKAAPAGFDLSTHRNYGKYGSFDDLRSAFDSSITGDTGPLYSPSRGDELYGTQLDRYLAGDISLEDEFHEEYHDTIYYQSMEIAQDRAQELGADWHSLSGDEKEELRILVCEADYSTNIASEIAQNTPRKLMRIPINSGITLDKEVERESALYSYCSFYHDDSANSEATNNREKLLSRLLAQSGVDIGANASVIRELAEDSPTNFDNCRLDVLWSGAITSVNLPFKDDGTSTRSMQFTDPHIVLIDPRNGQHVSVEIKGQLETKVTKGHPAIIDSNDGNNGVGVSETVGGLSTSVFATHMEPEPSE